MNDKTAKSNLRFHKGIQDKNTGSVVFFIPDSKDEAEREGSLSEQIVQQLVSFSNMYESYDKAIEEVQRYLKSLILHYPEEEEFIKRTADKAGELFLRIVDQAKSRALRTTIERGEMFLKIKDIKGGK